MGSALLETPLEEMPAPSGRAALREEVAERVAAHRRRRSRLQPASADSQPQVASTQLPRASRVASAVAERYANAPSYRAILAAQAERAIAEAAAAAEVAALNAKAVEAAQMQLLADLDQWTEAPLAPALVQTHAARAARPAVADAPGTAAVDEAAQRLTLPRFAGTGVESSRGLTVRLFEQIAPPASPAKAHARSSHAASESDREARALDEEIAFRQAPVFEEPAGPAIALPANLIEFPRQLVASRKVRPRHAEGPLRDESLDDHPGQLRIFEVEADLISTTPVIDSARAEDHVAIWLDTVHPEPDLAVDFELAATVAPAPTPQAAPLGDRAMAFIVDGCLTVAGFLAFSAAFAVTAGKTLDVSAVPMPVAAIGCGTFASFYLLYQALFFSLACATPGMRYARVALCTLADGNPTRRDMQRRILATLLPVCSLGLGFVWACVDKDSLGWHDRLTGTYQRSY